MFTSNNQFDIMVYGATGFTGQLVVRYLLTNEETTPTNPKALKWAMAGRSQQKLDQVKEKVKQHVPSVPSELIDHIPTVVAACNDEDAITRMVASTRVVLTIVGPYAKYGSILLGKCAEKGVHYCDLTGELLWAESLMQKYEPIAKKTGARLIHCCGYESVPSDMTTYLIADLIEKKYKTKCAQVNFFMDEGNGGVSGGTIASVLNIFDTYKKKDLDRMKPFLLTDEVTRKQKEASGLVKPNEGSLSVTYEKELNKYSSIFIGAGVNSAIVHRTNFLLKKYTDNFIYRERISSGGWLAQYIVTFGTILLGIMAYLKPTREFLRWILPSPGQGPSEKQLKENYFVMKGFGFNEKGEALVSAVTRGQGDGGYLLTSQMIAECAIGLAKNETENDKQPPQGGYYTPASAFGHHLAKRLQEKHVLSFELKELK
jgi:short subunit dehydrogenase-like uncharacterized protein